VAAAICAEAIVVIGYGFVLAIEILVAKATSRTGAAFLAVLVVVIGAGAPGLVWQVLQLAVATPAIGARPGLGIPLAAVAALTGAGLLVPGVVEDAPG
jgi:hypothetical protein